MKRTKKRSVLILGAGLAGLAAGYELVKAGFEVTILEKWDDVGGLARTIKWGDFLFDTGPHRWYTKNDMVNTWMLKLLGKEIIQVPRLTRIYFDKIFFNYPIKIKSTLKGMGIVKTLQAVFDYGLIRFSQLVVKKEVVTLEQGYISKFGTTLYKMFFQRYSEKLWGTSCKNISADWIGQRTRGFNISTIIKDILFKSRDVVSFVDEFSYPERGIGRIAEKLAEGVKKGGGKILLNSEVIKLQHTKRRITHVDVKQKTSTKKFATNEVISTIAISDLIRQLSPSASAEILTTNKTLTYRDELQVALFVKKTNITPDTWVYVHSFDLPFIRFMEMDNWSDTLSSSGTTTLVFEVACNEGDPTWKKPDNEIIDLIKEAFIQEFKLVSEKDIIGGYVHRVPKEYPVYHLGYKKDLKLLKVYLSHFDNLQIAGRNGIFRYNNMDHSIEMGLYAAWNIIEGERKFDIESVNIEREYLEEKHLQSQDPELPEDKYVEEEKH